MSRVDVNGFATGALQVFIEGAWGAVCSSNFDNVDAAVACRQLGFSAGVRQSQRPVASLDTPDPVCSMIKYHNLEESMQSYMYLIVSEASLPMHLRSLYR